MGAMASAVFFLISWALSTGLQPVYNSFIWITYMGIGGVGLLSILDHGHRYILHRAPR